jgi:hypothetical protein
VYDVRFTSAQYEEAIANLRDAMTQLEPDGRCCVVCGDSGHMAWECGHNPLYAIACCEQIADRATSFHADMHATDEAANVRNVTAEIADQREAAHELLHMLSGACTYMGVRIGPARVVLP